MRDPRATTTTKLSAICFCQGLAVDVHGHRCPGGSEFHLANEERGERFVSSVCLAMTLHAWSGAAKCGTTTIRDLPLHTDPQTDST